MGDLYLPRVECPQSEPRRDGARAQLGRHGRSDTRATLDLSAPYIFEVEGYDEPWFLVSTALDLSPEQVVEVFAARFRQEEGFRDHKQRLGMEECRAWTKEPILRTFQVQMVAMTLLRLLQFRLDAAWGKGSYWLKPDWNRRKQHPSILDLRRLFWRHRERLSQLLLALEELQKSETTPQQRRKTALAAA